MDNINKLQNNALESNKVGKGQEPVAVEKFGFPVATSCGFIPQNNEWLDDWVVSVFPTQVFFFFFFFILLSSVDLMLSQVGEFVVYIHLHVDIKPIHNACTESFQMASFVI